MVLDRNFTPYFICAFFNIFFISKLFFTKNIVIFFNNTSENKHSRVCVFAFFIFIIFI